MKVAIAGGGSGGHLFPGIAVAQEIMRRDRRSEVLFIGTEQGIEGRVVPREGYPIRYIDVQGVAGKSLSSKLSGMWKVLVAIFESRAILKDTKPDLVVGSGGYVSVAPVVAAWLMSIPTVVLEQNIVPGLANRTLAKVADLVAVTYMESMPEFPKYKTVLTGNPVRESIMTGDREQARMLFKLDSKRQTVLVLGGSSGAKRINEALMASLDQLLDVRGQVQFIHQTGETQYERMKKMYASLGFRAACAPFFHHMAEAYALADIVLSRAGATTLAELTALGKPAILVPYPYAGAHQEHNARKLHDMGAGRMVLDADLDGQSLAACIKEFMQSGALRKDMRERARTLGRPDAAQKVVDMMTSLLRARASYVRAV